MFSSHRKSSSEGEDQPPNENANRNHDNNVPTGPNPPETGTNTGFFADDDIGIGGLFDENVNEDANHNNDNNVPTGPNPAETGTNTGATNDDFDIFDENIDRGIDALNREGQQNQGRLITLYETFKCIHLMTKAPIYPVNRL